MSSAAIVSARIRMERIARHQQHPAAVMLDQLRLTADDRAPPRPCQGIVHRLERLQLYGGFRIAKLVAIHADRHRSRTADSSHPVTKLDVAIDAIDELVVR